MPVTRRKHLLHGFDVVRVPCKNFTLRNLEQYKHWVNQVSILAQQTSVRNYYFLCRTKGGFRGNPKPFSITRYIERNLLHIRVPRRSHYNIILPTT